MATVLAVAAASPSAQSSSQAPAAGTRVTATGCVERADQVSNATAVANADPDSLSFVLLKAGTRDARASSAKPDSTSAKAANPIAPLYTLDGAVAQLNPHVGHEVEISGTIVAPAPRQAAGDTTAAVPGRLRVDNIRMIAETCSALKTAPSLD